jgi:hypothetical protein
MTINAIWSKIQRCFICLDPDYAGKDTSQYPWRKNE